MKKLDAKKIGLIGLISIIILGLSLVNKTFQNDTFYTIKIGELILNNGIDMMDHFSFHANLAYSYPHWMYDVFIYLIYSIGGYTGLYISSMLLFLILIVCIYRTNIKINGNTLISMFSTLICVLALANFVTARAQLVSFIVFILEIYFIEMFLNSGKKKYLFGLILLSLIICNIHVAVWPFYYILFLPYIAEYIISLFVGRIKDNNMMKRLLESKFIFEKNKYIKYLLIVMLVSLLTGFLTPIEDTPFTYLIKTMMGNSQDYITEHQGITWANSPFVIIIAVETIVLGLICKIKLRDFFMIGGLLLMAITSCRHLSLLALIGTICFCRLFYMFSKKISDDIDKTIVNGINKRKYLLFIPVIAILIVSIISFNIQFKKPYVDSKLYPVTAVKYIKENIDMDNMRLYNDYDFGSYLLLNDIKVFIDSRADLYTKQFSGFEYDIFDDYHFRYINYKEKLNFYDITHLLLYKDSSGYYNFMMVDDDYEILYEDDNFILFEKVL